ncbi:MAG: hypothetical protein LBF97_05335, partial [Elusimicrobiota bacterium]|nr:hypothetical protein [Elusimicrobiota bacterium]
MLVNLNDAVYRMMNPKMLSYDTYTAKDFNRQNCPLIYEVESLNKVVTYLDWVKILGGNPATNALNARSCGRIRGGTHDGYNTTDNQNNWGRTFGKPAGPHGKTLAESKPL